MLTRSSRHLAVALAGVLSVAGVSRASTLVSWDFNGQSLVSDGTQDNQSQTITSSGLSNPTPNNTAGVAFATTGPGSVSGIGGGSGSTTDYYLRAGIGTGGTTAKSNEGGSIAWAANTTGATGITVTWAADNSSATSGAFTTETLQYNDGSTNGYQTAATETLTQTFTTYTVNISALDPAIDNDPNAAFRIVFSGSTAYAGTGGPNARVDNLAVESVVPEPASLGLLGLGSLVAMRRRRMA